MGVGLTFTFLIAEVHDLHLWALGSREPVMTAHLVVNDPAMEPEAVRHFVAELLESRFHIEHATLQVESQACEGHGIHP